jgi:predicted SprT family Zn-dependent metalloprotease
MNRERNGILQAFQVGTGTWPQDLVSLSPRPPVCDCAPWPDIVESRCPMNPDHADMQLALPFTPTGSALKQTLEELLGRPVALVLTDNSTTVLSCAVRDGVLSVRLHRMFLSADSKVLGEIVTYLNKRRGAMPHFRSFLRANRESLRRKPAKKVVVRMRGRHHDLSELYDEINQAYFGNRITAAITWGRRSPATAVRKRTVGSYSERSNLIRINPLLDRKNVPRFYVAFIVYHEMLHADMGIALRGKRRSVHPREFRRREKLFQEYEKAMAWEGQREK